jgi:hypothetical protein
MDNVKRALRTALQFFAGLITGGIVLQVWESYVTDNQVDNTVKLAVYLILGSLATFIQNEVEDKTGHGVLIAEDRKTGDAVLNEGIGAK